MRLLRLSILFAFSIARAVCVDFEIFANQISLGCDAVVGVNAIYGDPLTLSISPTNGDIKWKATDVVVVGTESTYKPIITENANQIITYFVERNGISKTININVQVRPGYTVSFDTDGGTPSILPQVVMKDSLAKKPTQTLTKTGYDFDGWDFNFSTPITSNIVVKAKWKPKTFTVTFNSDGGSVVPSQTVNYNSTAIQPKPPTKTGYYFDGWDFNFSTPITSNIVIKAKWKDRQNTLDLFVKGIIEFKNSSFYLDDSLSDSLGIDGKQRHHFVAGTTFCNDVKSNNIKIQLTLQEPRAVLKRIKDSLHYEYIQPLGIDENNFLHYDIGLDFVSELNRGLDSLVYELALSDGSRPSEYYTVLLETPIPFDSIVVRKWNNVLFVNNSKGYEFQDFQWFENDIKIGGNSQFYSAGSKSYNVLNPSDTAYKVTMRTKDGIRVSTCKGKGKVIAVPPATTPATPKLTKQVLGIREKSVNSSSKIYNLNGKLTKETPAGVYIVEK